MVPRSLLDPTLCGMCCLISGPKEGFIYDVFSSCKLLSYYKYTCDTISVSACSGLLHAITKQGIETYTVRMYAAASDWIRVHAAVDVKLDQQLVEERSLAEWEDKPVDVMSDSKQSCQDMESKNAVDFSVGYQTETETRSSPATVSTKSAESADVISETNEDHNQELQSASTLRVTGDSPSSCDSNPSHVEALEEETPVKNVNPSGSELSHESSPDGKDDESSPSDVKLTVDDSGRTLVRFTSGSKSSSPAVPRKGTQPKDSHDSESNPEFTASQLSRAFAVMNPLSRSSSSSAKLSDAAYLAAMNKLSSDCGWTLPVFDLESLRQVGGLRLPTEQSNNCSFAHRVPCGQWRGFMSTMSFKSIGPVSPLNGFID